MKFFNNQRVRLAAIVAVSMAAGGAMTGIAMAGQPHMTSARALLQRADQQLHQAASDKGGYRLQAIDYTERAIEAVDQGIQVGY